METATRHEGPAAVPRPPQINFPNFPITADDTVVDVGCGAGDACVYAGHQGADVIGIDVEPSLVAQAAEAMRDVPARSFRGIVSDADPIPLPDACASVVVATEVMEHVDRPDRFLAELVRIGRPGARYLVSVPDPVSETVMRAVAPPWYWEKPLHIHVFSHRDLDDLFAAAGLVVEGRYAGGFYWSMWWFLRFAIVMSHKYEPPPPHPALRAWDEVMDHLLATPRGPEVLRQLSELVPKSQALIARKPAGPGSSSSFGGPSWRRRGLKRFLRDGSVRLGGFDLCWKVRRAAS
jgi:SAM-dependent methyltransferase